MNKKLLFGGLLIGVVFIVAKSKDFLNTAYESVIDRMAAAIQDFEGWYPGSRSFRNNNPGNLRWFSDSFPWTGATGVDESNHVIFDSYESGLSALKYQLRLAFSGSSSIYSPFDTLYQFFTKYAEGNQDAYARFVAARLGVSPDSTLGSLGG